MSHNIALNQLARKTTTGSTLTAGTMTLSPYQVQLGQDWYNGNLHTIQALGVKTMQLKKGKFYVVNEAGSFQSEHDTKQDALVACEKCTTKYDAEFFVVAPIAATRPKKDTITEEF